MTAHRCLDEELLSLAARAGCVYLFLGLESFSPQSLRDANKSFNREEEYAHVVSLLHRHRIAVQAGIVFGFDSDAPDVFAHTLAGCERIGIDGVTPSVLTPFPGTPLYDQFQREGRLLPVDWSYYNGKRRVCFRPRQMTPAELLRGYHDFRGRFYSWGSIARRLSRSRTQPCYTLSVNVGYHNAYRRFMGDNCNREYDEATAGVLVGAVVHSPEFVDPAADR